MKKEIETKILNVDRLTIRKKLLKNKAVLVKKRCLVKRWVYRLPDKKHNHWIRIIEDKHLSLAFKNYQSYKIGGIRELNFIINGELQELREFLELLGCKLIAEQHTYEERYLLPNKVVVDIEKWPYIPTYIEIEATNKKLVKQTVKLLGFTDKDSQPITTKMVYKKYNIDLHKFKLLNFSQENFKGRKKI